MFKQTPDARRINKTDTPERFKFGQINYYPGDLLVIIGVNLFVDVFVKFFFSDLPDLPVKKMNGNLLLFPVL